MVVDVTDFEERAISRYRVTLSRSNGRITRRAVAVDVPMATKEAFGKALEVLDTLEFIRPAEVGSSAPAAKVARLTTSYPSAYDLIDDNGYEEGKFSRLLNTTTWPNPESASLGDLDFGEVMRGALPVVQDYLEGRTALVTEAKDGTLIIVEPSIVVGSNGTWAIWWRIAERGLLRADGSLIREAHAAAE